MFEQDYIMRLISEIIRTLLKLLFNIDTRKKDSLLSDHTLSFEKYDRLLDLIDAGRIKEAEDQLMSELDQKDRNDFKLALMFYSYLNDKDDEFLEQYDYVRKDIPERIREISRIYECDSITASMINLFMDGI